MTATVRFSSLDNAPKKAAPSEQKLEKLRRPKHQSDMLQTSIGSPIFSPAACNCECTGGRLRTWGVFQSDWGHIRPICASIIKVARLRNRAPRNRSKIRAIFAKETTEIVEGVAECETVVVLVFPKFKSPSRPRLARVPPQLLGGLQYHILHLQDCHDHH